jgi:hypothetical protein
MREAVGSHLPVCCHAHNFVREKDQEGQEEGGIAAAMANGGGNGNGGKNNTNKNTPKVGVADEQGSELPPMTNKGGRSATFLAPVSSEV